MSYTAAQYTTQQRVMADVRWSNITGLCPVCRRRPIGTWPDGVKRITCSSECSDRWLRIHPPARSEAISALPPAPSAPPSPNLFQITFAKEKT